MKYKAWIVVLAVLVIMAVVPSAIGSGSPSVISFSYEDGNIDDNLGTAYTDSPLFEGDDFEKTLANEDWSGKYLTELSNEGMIRTTPNLSIKYDATGDGDIDDRDDYLVYNDLFFEDVSNKSIKLTPKYRVGYVEDLKGRVFKVKGQKYLLIDHSENRVDLVPVDENTYDDSRNKYGIDRPILLLRGTDIRIDLINIVNLGAGPSAKFAIIEGGVVLRYVNRSGLTDPPLKLGIDLNLVEDYYIYPTRIDVPNGHITLAIGRKTEEVSLSNGNRGFQNYDKVILRKDNETNRTELIFQDPSIEVERGYKARLGDTDVYAVYDSSGAFDLIREKTVFAASGSKLRESKAPWSEFLTTDVIVNAVGNNTVEFGYESHDLDDRTSTEVEGAVQAGDDVKTAAADETW
ncbi:MAG: hypothetical protein D6733_07300, partial [Methanobacteriota archaeon]